MSETCEMKTPTDRGDYVCHSSEEDGGPDVGYDIALGGGVNFWIGEIPRSEWQAGGGNSMALGPDTGWWIVVDTGSDRTILGKCADPYEARRIADAIIAALRAPSQPGHGPAKRREGE